MVSLGLRSPRRPTIERTPDELLTRQRLNEEALLVAIEGALARNDNASAEGLRLQLKEQQQRSLALREGLALESSARIAPRGHAQTLQACRQEVEDELEAARLLRMELLAVNEFAQELEARIEKSAARAESLAQKFGALLEAGRLNAEAKYGTSSEATLLKRCDIESHQQLGRIRPSQSPINEGPQWLVNQERAMSSGVEKSPRSVKHEKREKHDTKTEVKKHGHKSRSIRESQRKARQTLNLSDREGTYIIPSSSIGGSRATVDSTGLVLPTFPYRSHTDEARNSWSPRSPILSPREKSGILGQMPTLGRGRNNVHEVLQDLERSVKAASVDEIEKALEQLHSVAEGDVNLKDAVQHYRNEAQVARNESDALRQSANTLDEQADIIEKVSERGQVKGAIATLTEELGRRAVTVERDQVEETKISSGNNFGETTLLLEGVLEQLNRLDEKMSSQAQPADSVPPAKPSARVERGTVSPEKAVRKKAEHAQHVAQLKMLLATAEAKLEKWTDLANSANV